MGEWSVMRDTVTGLGLKTGNSSAGIPQSVTGDKGLWVMSSEDGSFHQLRDCQLLCFIDRSSASSSHELSESCFAFVWR